MCISGFYGVLRLRQHQNSPGARNTHYYTVGIPGWDSKDIITQLAFTAGIVRILLHSWFKGCQTYLTTRQQGFIVSYYNNAKMPPPHPRVVMGSMSPSGILVPPRAGYRTALGGTRIPSGDIKPISTRQI